jgi:hypothetical protein
MQEAEIYVSCAKNKIVSQKYPDQKELEVWLEQ